MSVRDVFARPALFRAFNVLIDADRAKELLVREYVRPAAGERLLDIGCGTGDIVPFLRGVDYVGFDENARCIRVARARYPGSTFRCERIDAGLSFGARFDVALAAGVLHHLDDEEALQLLNLAHASLRVGGRLVTIDGCYVAGQGAAARWLLSHDRGQYVRPKDEYERLMRSVFPDFRTVVRHDLLRVPYTHLIARCERTRASGPDSRSI